MPFLFWTILSTRAFIYVVFLFDMTTILTALIILQIQQLFNRLFPFGRGLCHAYWAPNFWVFYIILDKVLAFLLRRLGFNIAIPEASFTGGLVGDSSPFAVLPKVTPITTFLLVLLAMTPCLVKAFSNPQPKHIIRWVSYACTCGFMFGWHVHEKASLHFTIPLALIAMDSLNDARHYFLLSIGMFCSWLYFNICSVPLATFPEKKNWCLFCPWKKYSFAILPASISAILPILPSMLSSNTMIVTSEMW